MAIESGFGVIWKISIASVLTVVPGLAEDPEFPVSEKKVYEVEAHDLAEKQFGLSGKRETQSFDLTVFQDTANAVHQALFTAAGSSGGAIGMTLETVGGKYKHAFSAFILKAAVKAGQEDAVKCTFTIQPVAGTTVTTVA